MGSLDTSLKIAILLNGFQSPLTPSIRASYISAISAASSLASISSSSSPPTIDFYDPIIAQKYPDPEQYDLIVLSGGTADPMGAQPWVLKLQEFLRTTARAYPKQKILGICWGHQTICVSFGGTVGNREGGAEVGVTDVQLTGEGREMLPFVSEAGGNLKIHEFHRREIKEPAKGFLPLADGSQGFINEANTIITFQGHPELNEWLAKAMLKDTPAYMGVSDEERGEITRRMERKHDGVRIWKRILEWVGE